MLVGQRGKELSQAAGVASFPVGLESDELQLSVVMPAYNEEDNIAGAIGDIVRHVFSVMTCSELIVVDDGSRDGTARIASSLAAADSRIKVMSQINAGHGPALVNGIRLARGIFCLLLDSDRQIDLQDFAQTWRLGKTSDAVIGVRQQRQDPVHRLILTKSLKTALHVLFDVRAADANAPYKLVRREIALAALDSMPPSPRIPSVLLTVYFSRRAYRVIEQPVTHFPRTAGQPSLRLHRLAVFCRSALIELTRFNRALSQRT